MPNINLQALYFRLVNVSKDSFIWLIFPMMVNEPLLKSETTLIPTDNPILSQEKMISRLLTCLWLPQLWQAILDKSGRDFSVQVEIFYLS